MLERQGEYLAQVHALLAHRVGIFLGHGLHAHIQQHQHKGKIAHAQHQLILPPSARGGDGHKARQQQGCIGGQGAENLIIADIRRPQALILGIEGVKPGGKARAEDAIHRMGEKLQYAKPYHPRVGIGDDQRHDGGGQDVHGAKINLRPYQHPFAALDALQDHGRKHEKAVGQRRDKGDDAHAHQVNIIHA